MPNNNKIAKGLLYLALTGVMVGSFAGCSKEPSNLFEGTPLEGAEVVFVDDQPLIMCYRDEVFGDTICPNIHFVGLGGECYHLQSGTVKGFKVCLNNKCISLDPNTTRRESLIPYLTSEEIEKALAKELTDADIVAIEDRIVHSK